MEAENKTKHSEVLSLEWLPATRKVCGFLGHTANLGCSSLVEFSEGFNRQNYTDFNIDTWILRTKSKDTEIKK